MLRRCLFGGTALIMALLVTSIVYIRVGWDRMDSACSRDMSDSTVSYTWDFPDGFTCRYSDGSTRSSLMWM